MAKFLRGHGVKEVAMEATGVYWLAPYNFLEDAGFSVVLLNPRSVKLLSSNKSDVQDCRWIQRLHSRSLAAECLVPPALNVSLRELTRTRKTLVLERSRDTNRMIKTLRGANISLERAVADVSGKTGLRIIDAIIEGERDPVSLAAMRDPRCRKSAAGIARCLDGVYRDTTVPILAVHRDSFRVKTGQIEEIDQETLCLLRKFPSAPEAPPAGPETAAGGNGEISLADEIARAAGNGIDLTEIPGISGLTALTILGEIGVSMDRFRTVKNFTSWPGLCPGCKISGGKILSGATRKVRSAASQAFMTAAMANRRSDSAYGYFYRWMKGRHGPQKALAALAHKIARAFYFMMKHGTARTREALAEAETRSRESRIAHLSRQASRLGMTLVACGEATSAA
jgi:transposase